MQHACTVDSACAASVCHSLCLYCSLTMNNPLEGVTGLPEEQKRRLEDAIEQMQVRDR